MTEKKHRSGLLLHTHIRPFYTLPLVNHHNDWKKEMKVIICCVHRYVNCKWFYLQLSTIVKKFWPLNSKENPVRASALVCVCRGSHTAQDKRKQENKSVAHWVHCQERMNDIMAAGKIARGRYWKKACLLPVKCPFNLNLTLFIPDETEEMIINVFS